jgi:hypothetical protein
MAIIRHHPRLIYHDKVKALHPKTMWHLLQSESSGEANSVSVHYMMQDTPQGYCHDLNIPK